MADDDLVLFSNVGLSDVDTSGQTSTVCEPSVANNGDQILATGNWYASRSLDRGATWAHISPRSFFPATDGGFCCDQTVIYEHSRDITIWLLQYLEDSGTNSLRVAVKRGPTLGNNAWHWYDFKPDQVNAAWTGEWFDYNHAALSHNFLYIGTNAFQSGGSGGFTRSVVMRLPLDELARAQGFTFNYFDTSQNGSLRCTQGAERTMYFASHNNLAQIRLWEWPEDTTTLSVYDIDVTQYEAGDYESSPAGQGWLSRTDPRITGGWVGKGRIGFMWTANADATHDAPYIRVVRIDETTKNLADEPDIRNDRFAFAYPDVSPNDRGEIGVSMLVGGGPFNLTHAVGMRDDADTRWRLAGTAFGTDLPSGGTSGDYTTVRRHSPNGLTWMAAGYSLQGGPGRSDVETRIVHFGRRGYQPAASRWFGV